MPQTEMELMQELAKTFTAFREASDKEIADMKKGQADILNTIKANNLNQRLDQIQDQINNFAKVQNRQGLGTDGSAVTEEQRAYKNALLAYVRRGPAVSSEIQAALSVGSDADGGFLVHPDLSGRIVKLVFETSPVRQVANVVTIGTDALEGINDLDEAGAGWTGETDARNETTSPKIGEYRIPAHELYAEPRATQKMLDDASLDIEAWLAGKVADKLSRLENASFFAGDGVKKPRGFLTYAAGTPSASAFNVIEQVVSGANGAFAGTNPGDALINLVYALKSAYRQNAVFMLRRATLAAVRRLKDGQGNYLWQPDFQQRQGGTLLGFNVVEAEDMPALAANSLSIAFGDFNAGYQIVDRAGIRILRDAYTAKPYVKFYTTKRTGGDVVNFEAIKLMKFST
jgi:HK97 family phage major capsid protein